jgi:hypothetical protein
MRILCIHNEGTHPSVIALLLVPSNDAEAVQEVEQDLDLQALIARLTVCQIHPTRKFAALKYSDNEWQ